MGVDFINRTERSFERACRRGYTDLNRVRLFDATVEVAERTFLADMESSAPPASADVVLRMEGDGIGVYCDEKRIAKSRNVPPLILEKLKGAELGMALGQIGHIHTFASKLDISVM